VFARAHALSATAGTTELVIRPNANGVLLVRDHRYRITLRVWITDTTADERTVSVGVYGVQLGVTCTPTPQQPSNE
jgi:hypothetical protein